MHIGTWETINRSQKGASSTIRTIANLHEVIQAIQQIPNIYLTTVEFSKISFEKQINVIHSNHIFIGFHGAGMTHILNMPIGM